MKVIKNYLYNAVYQLFVVLIPFVTIPYLSRVLGPKGVGINSYTNSVIQYFILIGDMGITLYGDRKIAYVRNSKYKLTQTFYELIIIQICTLTIAYFIFIIFLLFINQYRIYYLAQSIYIIANALDISWLFVGLEKFKVIVLRNVIAKVLVIVCIFLFVKSYSDLINYIILCGLASLLGNLALFINLHKYIGIPDVRNMNIMQHFLPALALFIPNVATQIYLVINKTMLGFIDDVQDAGFYDQSDKVIRMVLAIVTAIGPVMLSHMSYIFANRGKKSTIRYLYASFSFVTALSVAMVFGVSAIAPIFVPLFFGNKFKVVIPLMMIESIIILLIAWSNAIGYQYLLPTKQTPQFTISVVIGSVVNILLNIPMILIFGVIGSVISTVISECFIIGYQLVVIYNQISFKSLFLDLYKYIISGIIMFLIISIMNFNFNSTWILLILEIIIGIIVYIGFIFFLRSDVFNIVKKIFKESSV